MNIFTSALVLILCASCVLNENLVRLKREPPVYRPVSIYRPVYGPPRYGAPKLNYSPVYGPPKSYYGSPKPIYGPPNLIYRPPPRSIYDYRVSNYPSYYHRSPPSYYSPPPPPPPTSNYDVPSSLIYGPPTSSYDASFYHSTNSHSYPARPSQSYGAPAPSPSHLPPHSDSYGAPVPAPNPSHLPPPSNNYGPPVQNYRPIYPDYNTQPSSTGYEGTYPPQQPLYKSYGPPSHDPSGFESPDNYAKPPSSYEVPITQSPPALQYDTSSASYGTLGAVTSYGTPVGNHELKRMNSPPYVQEPFALFEEGDAYGSSSNLAHIGEPFKITTANKTCKHFVTRSVDKVASNHNYDGPGVSDDFETQKVKRTQIKKAPINSNYIEERDYLINECNN